MAKKAKKRKRLRKVVKGELLGRLRELWEAGVTVRTIAKRLGMSPTAVSRAAACEGFPARSGGRRPQEDPHAGSDRKREEQPHSGTHGPVDGPPDLDEYAEVRLLYGEEGLRRLGLTLALKPKVGAEDKNKT